MFFCGKWSVKLSKQWVKNYIKNLSIYKIDATKSKLDPFKEPYQN